MRNAIQAVCHDYRSLISGVIRNVTEIGCELQSSINTPDPVFPQKASILLNLLDEKSGKTVNVRARLTGFSRESGGWVYRIRWAVVPELLRAA